MTGTLTKRSRRDGNLAWGYSFFAGRMPGGKRIQMTKSSQRNKLFPLFITAAFTGCRRGEPLAMEWRDIDFQTGVITVSKSREQTKMGLRIKRTKSGKPRRFLLPCAADAFEVVEA